MAQQNVCHHHSQSQSQSQSLQSPRLCCESDIQLWLNTLSLNQIDTSHSVTAIGTITKRRVQKHQIFYMLQLTSSALASPVSRQSSALIQLVVNTSTVSTLNTSEECLCDTHDKTTAPQSPTHVSTPQITPIAHSLELRHITPHLRVGAQIKVLGYPACDRVASLSLYLTQASLVRCAPVPSAIYRLLESADSNFLSRKEILTALVLSDDPEGGEAETLLSLAETRTKICQDNKEENSEEKKAALLQQAAAQYSRRMLGKGLYMTHQTPY